MAKYSLTKLILENEDDGAADRTALSQDILVYPKNPTTIEAIEAA